MKSRRSAVHDARFVRRRFVALALAAWLACADARAQAAPFAYVVNHGDGTVSVLDTASNAVVTTVTVGDEPLGAAVNPAGTRAFVTNQTAPTGSVSVIDTAINGVVATIPLGNRPSGVAVKLPGDRLYVTNRDDKNVSVVDTATLAVLATVPVGNNPLGIAIDPAGSPAYVVNKGTNNVSVIDTTSNTVVATIPVGNDPSHVAVSPNGLRVYVTNGSNASVSVIDTGFNSVIATVDVGNIPEGVTVDPSGARAYVANSGPNNVSVIDTATNGVVATVSVGFTPFELSVRPDGARLFVINRGGGDVSVIDTASNTVATTVDVGFGPSGFGGFVVPAVLTPRFTKTARKCQKALALQAAKFAKLERGLEAKCRLGIIKAEAAGKGTAKAEAACTKALDLASPLSKLFRARAKANVAIARGCRSIVPRQINGPCARGAADFNETGACVLVQHIAQVGLLMTQEFSITRPSPLDVAARACQSAITKNGRRYADKLHKDLLKCFDKELAATDVGTGEAKAVTTCLAKLDLASPLSVASVARATAVGAIALKCQGLTPAALGSPCDGAAPTFAATAECVMNGHAARVAKMVAAEFNDACVTLTRIGLADSYPAVCSGP